MSPNRKRLPLGRGRTRRGTGGDPARGGSRSGSGQGPGYRSNSTRGGGSSSKSRKDSEDDSEIGPRIAGLEPADVPPDPFGPGERRKRIASLDDVLSQLVRDKGLRRRGTESAAFDAWTEVAGEALARQTQPVRYVRGELTVEVAGPALLAELKGFKQPSLERALRTRLQAQGFRRLALRPARDT